MGQYHKLANLDKRQIVNPHRLGAGLKLWEQMASNPGTGTALVILLASASNGQGGGDLRSGEIVGSWLGDRIAFVGDYDTDSSYLVDGRQMTGSEIYHDPEGWTDISDLVAAAIEVELDGKYQGTGWRKFVYAEGNEATRAMKPDMVIVAKR